MTTCPRLPTETVEPPLPSLVPPPLRRTALLSILAAGLTLAPPLAAVAMGGEEAPDGFFELILHTVESLGPLGPAAFILAVASLECVPLLPTQPLSLASGLLFGAQKGALCMLTGTTLAALLAFALARGVGRPLAEKIIRHEMSESGGHGGNGGGSSRSTVQSKLQEGVAAIENGTFWQQAGAVFVLRMTPFVPFSASNYILGLSPLPLPPYVLGTTVGMAFWSCVYASLGGASRALLRKGADPDALLNDLLHRTSALTEEAGVVAAVVAGVAALVCGGYMALSSGGGGGRKFFGQSMDIDELGSGGGGTDDGTGGGGEVDLNVTDRVAAAAARMLAQQQEEFVGKE